MKSRKQNVITLPGRFKRRVGMDGEPHRAGFDPEQTDYFDKIRPGTLRSTMQ